MNDWPTLRFGTAGALLADDAMAALFEVDAELYAMLAFERALARAQHQAGEFEADALEAIEEACISGTLKRADLLKGLQRDGVIVPSFVRQIRAAIRVPHAGCFHLGTTSQDVADTSLMMRLKPAVNLLETRLTGIIAQLQALNAEHGALPVMARTRYRDAMEITLADRVETWARPLRDLARTAPGIFLLQLGGPVGQREAAFGPKHDEIAGVLAQSLGLSDPGHAWHTDRRPILAITNWCAEVGNALGKIGQDIALMAQNPVAELQAPGGSSSTIPLKSNPVGAELLVTLARLISGQAAMVQSAGVHENEGSGVAWTLEWLALPPVVMGCGASTRAAASLIAGLKPPGA